MKNKYVTPKIDVELISTCDVIQSSRGFDYEPGSISYSSVGSEGTSISLW